jgi:hypothetical protein
VIAAPVHDEEDRLEVRNAMKADAGNLAYLINLSGEGIPEYLWTRRAEAGESPLDVGARRAARDEGNFSDTHARVCVEEGTLLGMMLSYPQPDPCETGEVSDYPDVVRPLVPLEAKAPGSW